jgi:hypothetical protein
MSLQEKQPPPAAPRGGRDTRQERADQVELQKVAFEAFVRDLPVLLGEHAGNWVAYHGAERLGIADNDADLYELGRQRGLSPQAMLVIGIDPEADQVPVISESDLSSGARIETDDVTCQ